MPKHNAAAPVTHPIEKQPIHFLHGLAEAEFDHGKDEAGKPKQEIVLTCLQEGPGNARDRRWYTRECVDGLESAVYARRKLFVDHLSEGAVAASDSLRNWAGTILKTWTVTEGGVLKRKVRAKIHEGWLWQRCVEAPNEMALSIEGRGAGRQDKVNGEDYTVIERIYSLNAFKFVPYPGNATMGADVVEADALTVAPTQEDATMDLKALTLKDLKEGRPDLLDAVAEEAAQAAKAKLEEEARVKSGDAIAQLREEMKVKFEGHVKTLNGTIAKLESELQETRKELDGAQVREKLRGKEHVIATALAEAKLPAEAITDLFMSTLRACAEREVEDGKGGKKILTMAEQVKAHIAERQALLKPELGAPRLDKDGNAVREQIRAAGELTEDERQFLFDKEFLGLHEGVKDIFEYREKRDGKKTDKKDGQAA